MSARIPQLYASPKAKPSPTPTPTPNPNPTPNPFSDDHDAGVSIGTLLLSERQPERQPRQPGQPGQPQPLHPPPRLVRTPSKSIQTQDASRVHSISASVHIDEYSQLPPNHPHHPQPRARLPAPISIDERPKSILQTRPTLQISLPPAPAPLPLPTPHYPNTPISPHLAAPPRAHFGAGTGGDNASIRGFDSMREKSATFREGEDEVFTPFSPRARQAGPRRVVGKSGLGRRSVYSTVDFWKRFSVVARHGEKESSWMAERKRSIWGNWLFVVPLVVTICGVGAIIVYLVLRANT